MTLGDIGHFFHELAEENQEGAQCLLKLQNEPWARVLFQDVQKPSQDEWSKTLETMEAVSSLDGNLNQAFLDLHSLVVACKTFMSVTSWKTTSCNEDVKLIKKMDNDLTKLHRLAVP
jgi:ferritin light chain